jgi:hypothetical protein
MFATSPFERPQNEQLNPRAFIFEIIGTSPVAAWLFAVRNNFVY